MTSVFLVQHLHILPDDEEEVKIIGIYGSEEKAIEAIDRVKVQPGFCDFPEIIDLLEGDEENGFCIEEYELDKDDWTEGFVAV